MHCPICSREMQEGSLVASGHRLGWLPKKKFPYLTFSNMQDIGTYPWGSFGCAVAPGAYYCESCKKVTGIFDVTF